MENGHCISEDKSNACDIKKTRSLQGSFALFNYTRKYNRFEAFLTISLMFSFHDTLQVTVTSSSFALWTTSSSGPFTRMG